MDHTYCNVFAIAVKWYVSSNHGSCSAITDMYFSALEPNRTVQIPSFYLLPESKGNPAKKDSELLIWIDSIRNFGSSGFFLHPNLEMDRLLETVVYPNPMVDPAEVAYNHSTGSHLVEFTIQFRISNDLLWTMVSSPAPNF